VLVTHHCEEIPPGFTHGGLVRGGNLMRAGVLREVITSENVSACFGVEVTVGCNDGRWWSRATLSSRRHG
jgi:iron complex transport system ATP-binding protein